MSEENALVASEPSGGGLSPTWIYVLYLIALFTALPVLIGVIIAYVSRGGAGDMAASHYRYQIRTFWLGFLYIVVGILLPPFGLLLCLFAWVFVLIRSIKGLGWHNRGEPVPNPSTWWF
jgi:uncharacterized membrane protein